MSLSLENIHHMARLARLTLSEQEAPVVLERINRFFELVAAMEAVDTKNVEPLSHPLAVMAPVALHLQPDEVLPSVSRDACQRSAPLVEEGLFLVPKVVE